MCRILLFGGTTEGRKTADFLKEQNISFTLCVTTEYGAELAGAAQTLVGKLDGDGIRELLQSKKYDLVIDATHPFAVVVTENIKSACTAENVRLLRVLRDNESVENGIFFDSAVQIAAYLSENDGNALITTGSKELPLFTSICGFAKRLTVRVLPNESIISECMSLGFDTAHIIAEKGPFSLKQNLEQLKKCGAAYLVTKESGVIGGFPEKAEAARLFGAKLLVIKRPIENGLSFDELCNIIITEYAK